MVQNNKINIPIGAKIIIDALTAAGFEAYVVGGCVRDSLLGLVPHDWDICTSATPEQVSVCFQGQRIIETGLKHGTITIYSKNGGVVYPWDRKLLKHYKDRPVLHVWVNPVDVHAYVKIG